VAIELKIIADTAAELIETINGLSTLGRGTTTSAPAKVVAPEEAVQTMEQAAVAEETVRRTRRTKAEMEAASRPQLEASSPATCIDISSKSSHPSTSDEGTLAAQIREVNAADGQPTRADVEAATTAFCDPNTGKGSMKQAREILRANFLTVEGQPVDRLGPLQPKDFAAYIALLK
jgi:hypothetical protein